MDILVALFIFGGFMILFLGSLYRWAQRQNDHIRQQFALNSQALGFSVVAAEEYRTLETILAALPEWQDKKVVCRAAASTEVEEIKVYLLICDQDRRRVALQFAVSLFSSPTLQIPSFHSRLKIAANRSTDISWMKRLHLAGAGQHFICFYQTPKQLDKESLCCLLREGWQHLLAHEPDLAGNLDYFSC